MTRTQRLAESRAAEAERRLAIAPRGYKMLRLAELRIARTAALRAGARKGRVA